MKNKTINELTSLENPRLTDTLPIWDGTEGKTKKVSLAKIPANVITPVNSLPESPNILDRVYRYNNKYYVGNESAQTLTELASKADIPTVVDTVENGNMNPVTSNAVYDALNTVGVISNGIVPNASIATSSNELYAGKIGKIAMIHGNLIGCVMSDKIVTLATLDTSLAPAVAWVDVTIDPINTYHSNLRVWIIGNELRAIGPSGTADIRFTCTYFTD